MLADSVPVTSRASVEVWAMSTPTACLLLSRFPHASARLFAEFRRLRGSLPPADAQRFALHEAKNLRHAEMMAAVCMRHKQLAWKLGELQEQNLQCKSTCTAVVKTCQTCQTCGRLMTCHA